MSGCALDSQHGAGPQQRPETFAVVSAPVARKTDQIDTLDQSTQNLVHDRLGLRKTFKPKRNQEAN